MINGSLTTSRYQKLEVLSEPNYISPHICFPIITNGEHRKSMPKINKNGDFIVYLLYISNEVSVSIPIQQKSRLYQMSSPYSKKYSLYYHSKYPINQNQFPMGN